MNFITKSELRDIGKKQTNIYKNASMILAEEYKSFNSYKTYDIFLSHSSKDSELILGLKKYLEENFKLSVYVDWIEDKQLDRSKVNKKTAETLRGRMKNCKSLIYATSENSIGVNGSRWMPWELGYFDGLKRGKVAVMPIQDNRSDEFKGEEYLQLYDLVEKPYSLMDTLKVDNRNLSQWVNL